MSVSNLSSSLIPFFLSCFELSLKVNARERKLSLLLWLASSTSKTSSQQQEQAQASKSVVVGGRRGEKIILDRMAERITKSIWVENGNKREKYSREKERERERELVWEAKKKSL